MCNCNCGCGCSRPRAFDCLDDNTLLIIILVAMYLLFRSDSCMPRNNGCGCVCGGWQNNGCESSRGCDSSCGC